MFTIDTFNLGSPLGEKSGLGDRVITNVDLFDDRSIKGHGCEGLYDLQHPFP